MELVKNEAFKRPKLEALELKATQDDKRAVVLSLMTEPSNENSSRGS